MQTTFKYEVSWYEAMVIGRELVDRAIPHTIQDQKNGKVVFCLLDLPHRVYNRVRQIFKGNGLKK